MRAFVFALTLLAAAPQSLAAAAPTACAPPNLRALAPWIADVLCAHLAHSPTLARLVHAVAATPLIIHVEDAAGRTGAWDGRLRFAGAAGGRRYLRIDLRRQRDPAHSAAVLAHELRHALEVDTAAVADRTAFDRLFVEIGFAVPGPGDTPCYDTHAAIHAGLDTLRELSGRASTPGRRTALALHAAGAG